MRVSARPRLLAGIGIMAALSVAVFLGLFIPAVVESNLLESRRAEFEHVAQDLVADGLLDDVTGMPVDTEVFDSAVRLHFIGVDVERVVLWDSGSVARYSDHPDFIGTASDSDQIKEALSGTPVVASPEEDEAGVRSDVGLREYYIPIRAAEDDAVLAVFEVYERADSIAATLRSTRFVVWVSIGIGIGALFAFLISLATANARLLDRRRREAESLLADVATAQEAEREALLGILHDDIGQPLYRVLYAIEGGLSQMPDDTAVAGELADAAEVVRWIDDALRSELLMLHQGSIEDTDLDTLLAHLVDDVRTGGEIGVELTIHDHDSLEVGPRAALFRATREAVTNARRHSRAKRIKVTVTEGSNRLIVDVEDDGVGFSGEEGIGLRTARERLELIDGGSQVLPRPGGGTLFRAWVPHPSGSEA